MSDVSSKPIVLATNLGFPRIGAQRDLKKAVEAFWRGDSTQDLLLAEAQRLRAKHWRVQADAGLSHVPSNDFSLYDQVLDTIAMLGAVPARYKWSGDAVSLDVYFAMARGSQREGVDVTAMEMTKWFDTNYHYIVPEFEEKQTFALSSTKVLDEYLEAKALGLNTRPVLVGPATFVFLGKAKHVGYSEAATVDAILPVYAQVLARLQELGADWVQIDEPVLSLDLSEERKTILAAAYTKLASAAPKVKVLLVTYFDGLRDNAEFAFSLPVAGVHVDVCRSTGKANTTANVPSEIVAQAVALASKDAGRVLSLGLVDGRNVWKNDISSSLELAQTAVATLGPARVFVGPSCSLLHSPVDLASEQALRPEVRSWMAFATQKLSEIATIARGATEGVDAIAAECKASDAVVLDRKTSALIHDPAVKARVASITEAMKARHSSFAKRQETQHQAFKLPLFPTTSIGSFPQTAEIRRVRAAYKAGRLDEAGYQEAIKKEIRSVVEYQHKVGIDVLVHGEPERNDMVEYFGEQLQGYAFTANGWVQSYGSRCVKPPVIFGDVSRPKPMTVFWSSFAQSLTEKPMKGMLTGPVTILQWSFVRDDQPRRATAQQISLAIRDEVADLEAAGIRVIQIDEAAIREGLPLRKADRSEYLSWAVEAFRIASCTVKDSTQIHTHMCYSEFNDIIESVAAMDADVISIETSRSQMELLDAFVSFKYPNEIGPGVYDIHSPRVPTVEEMVELLHKAKKVLTVRQIWVNPDCGLKTRGWKEVEPALRDMVKAAEILRAESS